MSKPMIRIHDIETDEVIDREMTDEEFATYTEAKNQVDAQVAEAEAKAAQRKAVLEKLGLTAEEAETLLG